MSPSSPDPRPATKPGGRMGDRLVAYGLAAGRTATGMVALAAPRLLVRTLVDDSTERSGTILLGRMLAVRDLALGLATVDALRHSGRTARLLWLGAVCDATDGLLAVRNPNVTPAARRAVTAVAWVAAAAGVWQARRHDRLELAVRPDAVDTSDPMVHPTGVVG